MSTDPLFMKIGSEYYWYQNDHLGTPQMMATSSGAVVWSAKYSSFGKATVDPSSTVVNPLRFPGQYEDQETGLHYNFNRYYDSATGRYLITDPIGFLGGTNFFLYSMNNPQNSFDPMGLRRHTILDIPCPLATPFQMHNFKITMKVRFKWEYRKDMRECTFNYLREAVSCRSKKRENRCPASNKLTCKEGAKLKEIKCKLRASQWLILHAQYSILGPYGGNPNGCRNGLSFRGTKDYYKFNSTEAIEYYRNLVDSYKIYGHQWAW